MARGDVRCSQTRMRAIEPAGGIGFAARRAPGHAQRGDVAGVPTGWGEGVTDACSSAGAPSPRPSPQAKSDVADYARSMTARTRNTRVRGEREDRRVRPTVCRRNKHRDGTSSGRSPIIRLPSRACDRVNLLRVRGRRLRARRFHLSASWRDATSRLADASAPCLA
jgi:hypothetical protein